MKQLLFILLGCFAYSFTSGQSRAGITPVRDTSFNLANEFTKHRKNFPGIRPALPKTNRYIQAEKDITYSKTPERELRLDVFSPAGKAGKKRTAIIFIHGGGWRSGDRSMNNALLTELAALGYVCISPDYRLSTEALYPAAVHDIKTAIRWARKNADRFNIDPGKIVAAGHSAGGELAAFMGATNQMKVFEGKGEYLNQSSVVNAVINVDGTLAFIHPESGEGDDSKKTSAATYWLGYSKMENPGAWKEAGPLSHVGKHSPPFQFINSGVDRMHAGRDDFRKILSQHRIYSEVRTFRSAPHSFILFHPWFDTTIYYMDKFLRKTFTENKKFVTRIVVAMDGTGDFKSIQSAVNAVPDNNRRPVLIEVKKGIYREKLLIDSLKRFITLAGEDKYQTIIGWNDHTGKLTAAGDTINTRTSWTCKIKADGFTAQDITFLNDAGFSAGQAVAIESNGDKATFTNCRFIGNQDVLFLNSDKSRQYFQHCYIEGTTDFIFGSATAWFEQCHIYSMKNSHITAASTPRENEFGFVFNACDIDGDSLLNNVSLGRPWRPYAHVTYLRSYIGKHIKREGWSNWNNTDNYLTARYTEYGNFGPSADPVGRVPWARQLTPEEIKKYSIIYVLQGWNPLK